MAVLVTAIYAFFATRKTRMAVTSTAMTAGGPGPIKTACHTDRSIPIHAVNQSHLPRPWPVLDRLLARNGTWRSQPGVVMAVLVTAIYAFLRNQKCVDGRNKPVSSEDRP